MLSLTLLAAVITAAPGIQAAGPWKEVAREGDIVVEAQPVVGRSYKNLRAYVIVDVAPETMFPAIWGNGTLKEASPGVGTLEPIKMTPTYRLTYQVAPAPLVADRDYILETVKDSATSLRFRAVSHPSHPDREGFVRLTSIEGSTAAEAIDGRPGACRIVHTVYSEPGGGIPVWMAEGGQRDAVVAWLRELKRRALLLKTAKAP